MTVRRVKRPHVDCSIETCTRDVYSRGLCQSHYYRQRKYGEPKSKSERIAELEKRVEALLANLAIAQERYRRAESAYCRSCGGNRLSTDGGHGDYD
jgi:hypothetical protein